MSLIQGRRVDNMDLLAAIDVSCRSLKIGPECSGTEVDNAKRILRGVHLMPTFVNKPAALAPNAGFRINKSCPTIVQQFGDISEVKRFHDLTSNRREDFGVNT